MNNFRPLIRRGSDQLLPFTVLLVVLTCLGPWAELHAHDHVVVLKAAHLFDGKSKTLLSNAIVVVQGDKIVDAGSNVTAPADAEVIDLGDMTLSPGFMDAHTHLTFDYSGDYNKTRIGQLSVNVSEIAPELHRLRASNCGGRVHH